MCIDVVKFIPATKEHYDSIIKLIRSPEELYLVYPSGTYPLDHEQLDHLSKTRSNLTAGLLNNKLVAFANLYNVKPNNFAFIGNIIVSSDHRGQGVGKAITHYMVKLCREKHNALARLSVFSFNTPALLLYTELGFTPYEVEQRKNLNGEKVALIHMQKDHHPS